jgi:hypothetical protein
LLSVGTFLFNLHLQAERAAVGAALSKTPGVLPAYVSDAQNGWVSIYPFDGASAATYARLLSDTLQCVALAFLVYDSDDCHCSVYNHGKRVARRFTGPEVEKPEQGDPLRFAKYALRGSASQFQRVFATQPVLAEETAFAVGRLFGLGRPRLEFSYEWVAHGSALPPTVIRVAT